MPEFIRHPFAHALCLRFAAEPLLTCHAGPVWLVNHRLTIATDFVPPATR